MPRPTRRQMLVLPALLWALPARADLFSSHPAIRLSPATQAGLAAGTYLGQWSDGSSLRYILRVIGPDMITLQRQGYSSPPVPYQRISPHSYQSGSGNTLSVLSPTRLRWTNAAGISVTYNLE